MRRSLEFLLGLLDRAETAHIAQEDWDGPHSEALRLWQRLGFIDTEPSANPVAGCPHCGEGVPYPIGPRLLCPVCRSSVDPRHLLLWRVHLLALLEWIAQQWRLQGGVRRLDAWLWQLGTGENVQGVFECFFRRSGSLSQAAQDRLSAYRQVIVLHGAPLPGGAGGNPPHLYLAELLRADETLALGAPSDAVRARQAVRFDPQSGALWVGGVLVGEAPLGSLAYHFLAILAAHRDQFVPYADLKREVLRRSGSIDTTDEMNFCQRIKSRLKKKVPAIDRLIVTSNKGDGYRLRAEIGPD